MNGAPRFVGGQPLAVAARGARVVGQEGALGADAGERVQPAVDGLQAERRHADEVGARVAQREGQVRLLAQGPRLGGQTRLAQHVKVAHRARPRDAVGGGVGQARVMGPRNIREKCRARLCATRAAVARGNKKLRRCRRPPPAPGSTRCSPRSAATAGRAFGRKGSTWRAPARSPSNRAPTTRSCCACARRAAWSRDGGAVSDRDRMGMRLSVARQPVRARSPRPPSPSRPARTPLVIERRRAATTTRIHRRRRCGRAAGRAARTRRPITGASRGRPGVDRGLPARRLQVHARAPTGCA